jgi:hypothetical protein
MRSRFLVVLLSLALPVILWSDAQAQSVQSVALAQSLLQDMEAAQATLDRNRSPWESADGRPQPEPVKALRLELPGTCIWAAFKPVDAAIRESYRQQRKSYLEKDAAIIDRRMARVGLEPLQEAITQEENAYPAGLVSLARRQVSQIDNALRHDEYNAAACIMWAMADALGLWDRQAALESAADQLTRLRAQGLCRKSVPSDEAKYMKNRLGCVSVMVERAVCWQPQVGVMAGELLSERTEQERRHPHWAEEHLEVGGAFEKWRENTSIDPGATAWVLRRPYYRCEMGEASFNTRDLVPCPKAYRDWQYTLGDYRWGWLEYTRSAANGLWRPHGDWRDLEPDAFWPGAKGSQTGGGL